MFAHDTIPRELLESTRAVLWNYVEVPDRPKPTKVPYQVRRPETKAAVDDAATWGEMREAILAAADGKADGVGIVLGDGLVGVDLDGDCRDPQTGRLTEDAQRIVAELSSYTEVSPSGTGVHILLRGTLPPGRRRIGSIEMYSEGRYFTVTGRHVAGTPRTIEERPEALARLHARIFPAVEREPVTPRPAPDVTLDDAALLAKASSAKNGARFCALWGGDTSAHNGDDSAADLALCNHLAFWADRDAFRIDRLFRQSGLMREKWDERRGAQTYGELTIARALESCTEGYTPRPEASQPTDASDRSADGATSRLIAERYPDFAVRLATRERPADVVPDLVPGTGITMLHGQPRSLKTWGLLDIATACATGGCVFGLERFRVVEPIETWYLTEEDGEIDSYGRTAALLAGREQGAPAKLHVSIHKAIDLDDPRTQALLLEYAKDCRIRVTIADPIRSVSAAVDQGPRELKPLAQFLRRYMRETGSIWILGHHDVKPLAGKPDDRPKPQRASGGGIFSIADSPIHVERLGTIGSRAIFTPSFYKGSATPDPVIVELTTDDPKRPTWAVLRGDTSSAPDADGVALHQQIRDYLRDHPGATGSAVAKGLHRGKAQALAALEQLHRTDEVMFVQRGQARLWSLLAREEQS